MSTIIIGCQCVNGALSGLFCVITVSVVAGFVCPVAVVFPGGRRVMFEFVTLAFRLRSLSILVVAILRLRSVAWTLTKNVCRSLTV